VRFSTPDDLSLPLWIRKSNSIATIVKHMKGTCARAGPNSSQPTARKLTGIATLNLSTAETRAELMALWEANWKLVFDALSPLTEADLGRKVPIRGEAHSVNASDQRQMGHYAYSRRTDCLSCEAFRRTELEDTPVPRRKSAI